MKSPQLKIGFPKPPPIGLVMTFDEQEYEVIRHDPHTTMGGVDIVLTVWAASCANCGQDGQMTTTETRGRPSRHCADCRSENKNGGHITRKSHRDVYKSRRASV